MKLCRFALLSLCWFASVAFAQTKLRVAYEGKDVSLDAGTIANFEYVDASAHPLKLILKETDSIPVSNGTVIPPGGVVYVWSNDIKEKILKISPKHNPQNINNVAVKVNGEYLVFNRDALRELLYEDLGEGKALRFVVPDGVKFLQNDGGNLADKVITSVRTSDEFKAAVRAVASPLHTEEESQSEDPNFGHEGNDERWSPTDVPAGFAVQAREPALIGGEVVAWNPDQELHLKLLSPTEPDVKISWYKVSVDGKQGDDGYYIDSHSLSLIKANRDADGTYKFRLRDLPATARRLDVQVAGKDTSFLMEDIAYVDPQKRNAWGGVFVQSKDGEFGYTAATNIPKLRGIAFDQAPEESAAVAVVEEAIRVTPAIPPPPQPSAVPQVAPSSHGGREFPQSFANKLHNESLVNLKGNAKDPGYGNIDRSYSSALQVNGKWDLGGMCNLHKPAICSAYKINDVTRPTRTEFLAIQAIALQESLNDPFAFRYERKFATKSPSWITRGYDKYKETHATRTADEANRRFRTYHTSYGLMQVFLPALSEWHPVDTKWKRARPGGIADVNEVLSYPARLLDPTTNFIWGIRLVRQNYQRSKSVINPDNAGLSEVAKLAAAYNGGPGSLRSVPPFVSSVACRAGIDTKCPTNGSRRVPYYEAVESITRALQNRCNVAEYPCDGVN